jgi:hypothetical protein
MMIGDAVRDFFKNLTMEYNRKGSTKATPNLPEVKDDDDDDYDELLPISRRSGCYYIPSCRSIKPSHILIPH